MSKIKYSFSALVRTERKRLKLSQDEMGEQAGISRNFVSMIERKTANPTIKTIQALLAETGYELVFVPVNIVSEFEEWMNAKEEQK
jgi:transcriptional regulator with XRE-family HTH domain